MTDIDNANSKMDLWTVDCLLLLLHLFWPQEATLVPTILSNVSSSNIFTWLCLNQNRFEQFPIARHGRVNKKAIKYSYSIAIDCHCRMPEAFKKNMIKCDRCSKWFQLELCVVTDKFSMKEKWFCKNCPV